MRVSKFWCPQQESASAGENKDSFSSLGVEALVQLVVTKRLQTLEIVVTRFLKHFYSHKATLLVEA